MERFLSIKYPLIFCSLYFNKTRGLRRWPTREKIVVRCNKFNPGSTDIFEFQVRTSELFVTSVTTSKECVHKNQNDISFGAGYITNFV